MISLSQYTFHLFGTIGNCREGIRRESGGSAVAHHGGDGGGWGFWARLLAVAIAVLLFTQDGKAQSASLTGRVVDPSGAVVSGAEVQA
jgi:hypothetical protein